MAQKFIGIDLGTHHIKVAVVSAGLRGVQMVDTFAEPVGPLPPAEEGEDPPDGFDHQLTVLFSMLRSRGLLGQPASICLPAGDTSYRLLSFPFKDERRIAATVGFASEGQFPRPSEDLVTGHLVVPSSEAGGRALVAAAPKDRISTVNAVFRRTNAEIKAVTTSALGVAAVCKVALPGPTPEMAENGRQPCAMVVDLGDKHTQFVAMGPKGPLAVRSTRRGGRQITAAIAKAYGLSASDAAVAKQSDAFLPHRGLGALSEEQLQAGQVVADAFEPVLRELEQTRLWLRATYHLEPIQLVLVGGGADLKGVREYVTEQTGLPVVPFTPAASGLKVDPGKGAALPSFAAALGAAYGAARRPLLRLRDTASPEAEGGWLQEKMASVVAIGVAVMAFGALDTIARVKAADAQLLAYENELATATEEAFGEPVGVNDVSNMLDSAEGADLTSLVPERGALETLAMLVKASTPSDLDSAPPPPVPGAVVPGMVAPGGIMDPGIGAVVGPDGQPIDPSAPVEPKPIGPIAADAGIVMVDDLALSLIDIRELKIELKASANTSSAQDRLAAKLSELSCISNVSKGKVRGEARKTFQMEMDSKCFYKKAVEPEEEAEMEASDPAGAGDAADQGEEE